MHILGSPIEIVVQSMNRPLLGKVEYIHRSLGESEVDTSSRADTPRDDMRVMQKEANLKTREKKNTNLTASADTFTSRARYLIENKISANHYFPFILISIVFILLFLFFAIVWYEIGGLDSDNDDTTDDGMLFGTQSWSDAFYFSLLMLATGQYDDSIPQSHGYRFVYFIMVFIGPTVIFAVLIGFINEQVQSFMENLKNGKSFVHENNHTLILGWNEATARVVVQTSFLRRQYQMMNENNFFILKYIPSLKGVFQYLNLLERASTSLANNAIVLMCNDHTKEEMELLLQQTLDERGIRADR